MSSVLRSRSLKYFAQGAYLKFIYMALIIYTSSPVTKLRSASLPLGSAMEIPSVDTEVSEFNADDAQLIRTSSKTSPKISPSIAVRHKQLFPSTRQWRYIVGIVATSSLGSFLWGYNFAVIAGAMLLIDDHFNLSVLWHETIVTMLVVGATVGAAIAGTLNNKFGRWKVMMMSAILYGIGAVVMALAFSKIPLVIGRAVTGLAIGLYSVTGPVYVSEMSPSHIRGKLGLVNYFMTGGGMLGGAIANGLFSIDSKHAYTFGWRYMFGLAVVPSLLMCGGLWFLFETPRWLVFHGKLDRAREVIMKIRNDNVIEEELQDIVNDYEFTSKIAVRMFQFVKQAIKNRTLLHAMFVGCSLQVLSQLSGASPVTAYSSTVLKMAGFSLKEAIWFATLPVFLNFVTKVISAFLVEKTGRRKLSIMSGAFITLSLSLLAVSFYLGNNDSPSAVPLDEGGKCDYSNCGTCVTNSHCGFCTVKVNGQYLHGTCSEGSMDGDEFSDNNTQCDALTNGITNITVPTNSSKLEWYYDHCPDNKFAIFSLLSLLLYMTSTSAGYISLPWIINSEIYPTWARGQAVSLASLISWLTSIVLMFTFLSMVDALGVPLVMVIYAIMTFCGIVFVVLFLPETSNQPLEKIERLFARPYFLTWCKITTCMDSQEVYTLIELKERNQ